MKKISIVTGTRAEYGLLRPLMEKIQQSEDFQLELVVTGMHLSPEFGETYKQIEQDGFVIDEKIEMLLSSDSTIGVLKSIGLATISLADTFNQLNADLVVILGDRFEMLAVAQSAFIMQIPIAHIHGGECTFGAYDDAIRHSITKMATWHFTTCEMHQKRVVQLGEHPNRVWNVGAPGIESIMNTTLLNKDELYNQLNLNKDKEFLLVTYHPETIGEVNGIGELLLVLQSYNHYNLVFTKANADNGGRYINEQIENALNSFSDAFLFDSLGQLRYLSAAKHARVVIGNSSSGLIEVPYLQTPTVNIGIRQAGRERPSSVINCENNAQSIKMAIEKALHFNEDYEQIYGNGRTSEKIMGILSSISNYKVTKEFYDL